jgi:hypothetical protein
MTKVKIWRTSEIEELLASATDTLQNYHNNDIVPGDEAVELIGSLVESLGGILSHEMEVS